MTCRSESGTGSRGASLWPATRFFLSLMAWLMAGCTATNGDVDRVDWYVVNSGSRLSIVVHDLVCNRRMNNVRLAPRSETRMTTCADESGQANIRYRQAGYASRSGGWTSQRLGPGGSVLVQ